MINFRKQILKRLLGESFSISYSQMGEDLVLEFILQNQNWLNFFYIDIGANDPVKFSNTYKFYQRGAKGVCVEPNPMLAARFRSIRPKDLMLNVGIGLGDEREAEFFEMNWHEFSTFDKEQAEIIQEAYKGKNDIIRTSKVALISVKDLLRKIGNQTIDFLNIDVEGLDEKILKSWDFASYAPRFICVEIFDLKRMTKNLEIEDLLIGEGYRRVAENPINGIYRLVK